MLVHVPQNEKKETQTSFSSPLLSHKVTPYLKSCPLCAITNCIIALLAGNSIKPMASLQLSISIISVRGIVMSWSEYSAEIEF